VQAAADENRGCCGGSKTCPFVRILRGLWRGWCVFGKAIGWVVSRAIMTVLFFVVFTPVCLFLRLIRKDLLHRRWDPEAASYWKPRKTGAFSPRRCERMY